MFGVYVESCILHIKLCSVLRRDIKLCSVYMSRAVFNTKKNMFGVLVECCILHIKLCSVYMSRAVFYT